MVEEKNGFVTYCKHFKYLGSWISYNLRDDHDVDMRIAAASKSMGALNHFFGRNEINIYSKYLIFMAIPISLLLWGCESWALRVDLSRKLERFVNRKIRKIININLWHVMKYKITVEEMHKRFNSIPSVVMIDIRTMQFLGKFFWGPVSLPPRQLLIAFIPNCRKRGRPIKCNRETLYESL